MSSVCVFLHLSLSCKQARGTLWSALQIVAPLSLPAGRVDFNHQQPGRALMSAFLGAHAWQIASLWHPRVKACSVPVGSQVAL